jgi:hypothetical protein
MATTQDIHAPTLGAQGEPCASCGAPLAGDQRYCLECGARRADARIPFRDILAREGPAGPPQPPVVRAYPQEHSGPSGVTFLVGLVALLLALGVGVLIGRSGDDTPTASTQPPAPQVISVGGAAAAPAATTSTPTTSTPATTSTSGSSGSSSSSGKSSSKGDAGSSSTSGSSKATNKDVKSLDNSSGSDYEKKSSKLPKQVGTGGKPPPKDNKPAGGGSDFQDIG